MKADFALNVDGKEVIVNGTNTSHPRAVWHGRPGTWHPTNQPDMAAKEAATRDMAWTTILTATA